MLFYRHFEMAHRLSISIAILGTVSVGKSTLLNALFVENFSEMKIRRTTMVPQVYMETDDQELLNPVEDVKNTNTVINTQLQERKESLTIEECKERVYYVKKIHDFNITLKPDCFLNIYDIPGLNDKTTSDVYFEYIKTNFYKFDIIIFVVDINSGLNTAEEMKILETVTDNIKTAVDKKKQVYMVTIINKCDSMEVKNGKLNLVDEEHQEMFEQVKKTVEEVGKKKGILKYMNNFAMLGAEDMFIYRMYKKYPDAPMDIKHMNKIGTNSMGKIPWVRSSEAEKKRKVKEILKNMSDEDMFKYCGFYELRSLISKILYNNELDFLINKVQNILNQIDERVISNDYNVETKMYSTATFLASKLYIIYSFSMTKNINKHMENRILEFIKINKIETVNDKQQFDALEIIKGHIMKFYSAFKSWFGKDEQATIDAGVKSINTTENDYLLKHINTIHNDPPKLIEIYKLLQNNKYEKLNELIIETTKNNLGTGRANNFSSNDSLIVLYYGKVFPQYFKDLQKIFNISVIDIIDLIFNCLLDKLDAWNVGVYTVLRYCHEVGIYLSSLDMDTLNEKIIKKYDKLMIYTNVTIGKIERHGYSLERSHLDNDVNMSLLEHLHTLVTPF